MALCEEAGFDEELRRTVVLGVAAALRRLHRARPRGRVRVRGRHRDPRPDARDGRRGSGRCRAHDGGGSRPPAIRPTSTRRSIRALQAGAHDWAVHNFATGCEVGDMLIQRLDLGPDCPGRVRVHLRAVERQRLPDATRKATRSRWRCASCTSPTTWRRSAAGPRRPRRSMPPTTVATGPTTRSSPTCSSPTAAAGSSSVDALDPWEAVLTLEPEPRRIAGWRRTGRGAHGGGRLHRPEVALPGRPQPTLRAARRGRRPACTVPRSRRSRRSARRPCCTSSARPRSRTRSWTSGVR